MTPDESDETAPQLSPAVRQTRQAIISAARECFARFGIKKTAISDIARGAGLSRATIYQHFVGKAEIVQASAEDAAEEYYRHLAKELEGTLTLEEQLGRAAAFVVRSRSLLEQLHPWFDTGPILPIFTSHAQSLLRSGTDFFVTYVEAGIDRGEVRSDIDAAAAAEWFTRMLFSLFSTPSPALHLEDPAVVRRLVSDYFVRGIHRPNP
jgi:AcrR family transcriptional regulator